MLKAFKNVVEWGVNLWLRVRPPKIQRYAGYVILGGLALILMSFNDILFEYILSPIGFKRNGLAAPIFGVTLTFLGLVTLILDRLIDSQPSKIRDQDQKLFQQVRTLAPWDLLDEFLNDLHNHNCWNRRFDMLSELLLYLEDDAHTFVDRNMNKSLLAFKHDLAVLLDFIAHNFFVPHGLTPDRQCLHPDISLDRTGQENDFFKEKEQEQKKHSNSFEVTYKKLMEQGRLRGMISNQIE
ncbi:MAG: hypothetical protein COA85_11185 [Robiginitomaculum sp.]|nr:MAG: hypothetical protein COA85_11185 [Robiginitomaculum sp.]